MIIAKDNDDVMITIPLSEFNSLRYYTLLLSTGKGLNQFERDNAMKVYLRIDKELNRTLELYKEIIE